MPKRIEPLNWLLLAMPVAIALEVLHGRGYAIDGLWIFLFSCLGIIPLAGLMGRATESLAESLGPGIGGLLNASFGNAAELIIALLALHQGETELVKASITGSILGNILLVLGAAIVAGGVRYERQVFNKQAASLGATLLALASIGLVLPTVHFLTLPSANQGERAAGNLETLSEEIAVVLALVYGLSLVFSLRTHRHLFASEESATHATPAPDWSRRTSLIVLLVATAGVGLLSEFLVGSVGEAAQALGMNRIFIGVIVVAIIGNAAEHSTAVLMALKNKMDLAVTIAIGSSMQIALFVAPVLVFASLLMGHPLDLHFTLLEVVAVVAAVAVMALVAQDGETHWMEGVLLLAVYTILGIAFYNQPEPVHP